MYKKRLTIIIALIFALFFQDKNKVPESKVSIEDTEIALVKVVRVIDGDTIELATGEKLRYIGVDTPETSDPRKPLQCFAKEATEKNRELVEGREVRLEKDISETDRYGRLLRYVYVGDEMINQKLVKEGFAYSSSYPPDVKYQEKFRQAEKEAKNENRGLWGACP